MLIEVPLFGGLAPSLLPYFLLAIALFVAIDRLLSGLGIWSLAWHAPLARFGLFLCVFSTLVLATGP